MSTLQVWILVLSLTAITYKIIMWIIATIRTVLDSNAVGFITLGRLNSVIKNEYSKLGWREYDEWIGGYLVHQFSSSSNPTCFHCTSFVIRRGSKVHGMIWDPFSYVIAVEILKYHKRKIKFIQHGGVRKFQAALWSPSSEAKQLLSS